MLDLLIIGGGVHGTALALTLTQTLGRARQSIQILDPHQHLMEVWENNCAACGMRYLRSPAAHTLSGDFFSLLKFARILAKRDSTFNVNEDLFGKYKRPSLRLFQEHSRYLVSQHQLKQIHTRGTATDITIRDNSVEVETSVGKIFARRVLLATGHSYQPKKIDWFQTARTHHPGLSLDYIYSDTFSRDALLASKRPIIVGGGISALQCALSLPQRGRVVIARSFTQVADFDSDPCFLGPACLREFSNTKDPQERARFISGKRNPGTVPGEIASAFQRQIGLGNIGYCIDEVRKITPTASGNPKEFTLEMASGRQLSGDFLVLATGIDSPPLQAPLYRRLVERYNLPVSTEIAEQQVPSLPVTDQSLCWHPRIMLSGTAAQLACGAASGNIIGTQLVLRKIIPYLLEQETAPARALWKPLRRPPTPTVAA